MDNLNLWNEVRKVPKSAQKQIQAGRLKGFTDINPVWRLGKLTEMFGACGVGWYYEITDKRLEQGSDGQVMCSVQINLYIKQDGEWSKPIQGIGGSMFIANERNGAYTSDECYKMALTDAISVSCKALGFGSDIYYNKPEDKYEMQTEKNEEPECDISKLKITPQQIKILQQVYKDENFNKLLEMNGLDRIEDMLMVKASEILKKLKERSNK